jgi:predicted nucleotidyltransferase
VRVESNQETKGGGHGGEEFQVRPRLDGSMIKSARTIKEIKQVLPRMKSILKKLYGSRLKDVILYGSFACDTATSESDIDVAVVLSGNVVKAREIDRMGEALYDFMLQTGELVSVCPVSEDELNGSVWPLYYHIRTDGIKI